MITVNIGIEDEDKYQPRSNDKQWNTLLEVIRNDPLRQLEKKRKAEAEKYIVMATKLIAPVVEAGFAEGYTWCIDQVCGVTGLFLSLHCYTFQINVEI